MGMSGTPRTSTEAVLSVLLSISQVHLSEVFAMRSITTKDNLTGWNQGHHRSETGNG